MSDNVDSEWAIDEGLYKYIRKTLPEGGVILELGSGEGTKRLAEHYKMYSVEHDKEWMDKYNSTYFYSPLRWHKPVKNHKGSEWYNSTILESHIKGLKYDLLLVDGPPQSRAGFVKYFRMFDTKAIMVFDDLQRGKEEKIVLSIATKLKVPYIVYGAGSKKLFGVINDPCTE